MKLQIEDNISYIEYKGYNITFWMDVVKKIKVNQSFKIKANAKQAALARANLDNTLKRKKINQKYSFKRSGETEYRIYRVA